MNIVIEGPDGSGKSTLATFISSITNRSLIHSPGPARTPEAMIARADEFLAMREVVFDRHCIVSEAIYGKMRGYVHLDDTFAQRFYETNPLVIYCRAGKTLRNHVPKGGYDTPEHLALVGDKHTQICELYDQWALKRAHICYRIGDDMRRVGSMIKGVLHNDRPRI